METQTQLEPQASEAEPLRVVQQPEPEKELISWKAPSRLFKKRNREYYTTIGALVFLLSLIFLFAREFLLIGVMLAIGFVGYALASVPPNQIKHVLTNKGIRTSDKLYWWGQMGRFWWSEKWKQDLLHVELPGQFPGQLILLAGKEEKEAIEKHLVKYLIKEKPEPTFLDKAAKWLQEKVPLETDA